MRKCDLYIPQKGELGRGQRGVNPHYAELHNLPSKEEGYTYAELVDWIESQCRRRRVKDKNGDPVSISLSGFKEAWDQLCEPMARVPTSWPSNILENRFRDSDCRAIGEDIKAGKRWRKAA